MCGIAGSLGPIDKLALDCTQRMNDAMAHRGPDQDGIWQSEGTSGVVLGHRRLSILDLSEAGRQPMIDIDTGVALAFNGECYNYAELRLELEAKGRRFNSTTDTEVILAAWLEWGEAAFSRLRGMFAIAIWDPRVEALFLVRDRLGIKPLYYAERNGRLIFASELRAILASNIVERRLDRRATSAFLWHGFVPGPRTIIEGVALLEAGTIMQIDRRSLKRKHRRFWSYPSSPKQPIMDTGDAVRNAGEALKTAVEQHLVSDVPLGVFLSGGIDSSVIAAMAQTVSKNPIATFNIRFDEANYDESPFARNIASALGTDHREVQLSESAFIENLDDALNSIDQPTFDAINTYYVSRSVKEAGLTVALAGTGGDELFGGYSSFADIPRLRRYAGPGSILPARLQRLLGRSLARAVMGAASEVAPQTRWGKLPDALSAGRDLLRQYQVSYALFTQDFLRSLDLGPASELDYGLEPEVAERLRTQISGEPELTAISQLEVAGFLGERLLRDTDAASMAVSLEVRVPLLDHIFVEALAHIPPDKRFQPLQTKAILRDMVRDRIDPAHFDRPKAGFELPLSIWCRRELSTRLDANFRDLNLSNRIGLNSESVSRIWRAFRKGGAGMYWSRVWSLYILMSWCQRHGVYA